MHRRMMDDETGRLILRERPVVSKATIPYERLISTAAASAASADGGAAGIKHNNDVTFGQAYGSFLQLHGFDPDGRDEVRYVEDETLAYVMLRYRQVGAREMCGEIPLPRRSTHFWIGHGCFGGNRREAAIDCIRRPHPVLLLLFRMTPQCHDFWHALTGLPPTVLGELALKWLELFQTGLPVAALSSTVGSLRLDPAEREILMEVYLPWAAEHATRMAGNGCCLMNVYYEKEFDTPLQELRRRLHLLEAPRV
jgi:Coenzyme Q (ubiquinone) biosynthesis protein Coq4